jgi:signal transduction histidine kinase
VLHSAIELIEREAEENDIQVRDNSPPTELWVHADSTLLLQVFLIVLLNAVQALKTGTSGRKRQIACSIESRGECTRIIFDDNGPGIPADVRSQVFDLFHTGSTEGIGMGLSICRSILERLNGTISLNPGPLGGERVILELCNLQTADRVTAFSSENEREPA